MLKMSLLSRPPNKNLINLANQMTKTNNVYEKLLKKHYILTIEWTQKLRWARIKKVSFFWCGTVRVYPYLPFSLRGENLCMKFNQSNKSKNITCPNVTWLQRKNFSTLRISFEAKSYSRSCKWVHVYLHLHLFSA